MAAGIAPRARSSSRPGTGSVTVSLLPRGSMVSSPSGSPSRKQALPAALRQTAAVEPSPLSTICGRGSNRGLCVVALVGGRARHGGSATATPDRPSMNRTSRSSTCPSSSRSPETRMALRVRGPYPRRHRRNCFPDRHSSPAGPDRLLKPRQRAASRDKRAGGRAFANEKSREPAPYGTKLPK